MTVAEPYQPISRYRWAVLLVSVLAFTMYAYALQSVPPLLGQFQAIYNIDATSVGLLMSMVVFPGIILALPAGILIGKYSFRKMGFLSTVAVAAGSVIMAFSSSFTLALFARFIIGLGGGLLSVGTPAIVPQWFEHKEMGKAMSVYAIGMPVGTVAAFFTSPVLAQSFGWQSVFYWGAGISALSAVFLLAVVRDGPLKGNSTIKLSDVGPTLTNREVWKASLTWMFFNMAAIGFLTWAPELFVTFKGLNPVNASIFSSLIMIAIIFFAPVLGYASDKSGMRKPFIVVSLLLTALSLYSITYLNGTALAISIVVLGAVASSVPPLVMAITAQALPPKSAGMSFSVFTLWQNLGIALIAPLVGYIFAITQSLSLTFLGLSLFAFVGALIALLIRAK